MHPTLDRAHAWIPRVGILALLASSASSGLAAGWRAPLLAPASASSRETTEDRVPAWAPTTLVGEVLVRRDGLGRLAVLVDEALGGRTSRGAATRLFLLTSQTPVAEHVDVRLGLASVVFRGDSLSVSTPSGRYAVDLALQSRSDGRRAIEPGGIVLHDGIALQSLRFAGAPRPIEEVTTEEWPSAIEGEGPVAAEGSCQAGGEGAVTCTKKCSAGAASVSFIDECSVTCNTGYHACCNCIVPREGATCTCVKDAVAGPKQPGAVKITN